MPTSPVVLLPLSREGLDVAGAHDVELEARSHSVHDPFIVHGSNRNHTGRRRCGITIKHVSTSGAIDRDYVSPTGVDWNGGWLYLARERGGNHRYWN